MISYHNPVTACLFVVDDRNQCPLIEPFIPTAAASNLRFASINEGKLKGIINRCVHSLVHIDETKANKIFDSGFVEEIRNVDTRPSKYKVFT